MRNKRKLDKVEFSAKESLRKRVRSRPNKTSNEGFDHDDPELHTPPTFPPRPKKDLKELKDWLQEVRQSVKRKDFTPEYVVRSGIPVNNIRDVGRSGFPYHFNG